MKKTIIAFLCGLLLGTTTSAYAIASYYDDVSTTDWFYHEVTSLSDKGIVNGFDDGTFKPYKNVTRAELAVMMDRLIKYIEGDDISNGNPGNQNDDVPEINIVSSIPSEIDDFGFEGSDALSISGDILSIAVGYGGGCQEHDFALYWNGSVVKTNPAQIDFYLIHDANGDMCEAALSETLQFDISAFKTKYNSRYRDDEDEVQVNVKGARGDYQSIDIDLY